MDRQLNPDRRRPRRNTRGRRALRRGNPRRLPGCPVSCLSPFPWPRGELMKRGHHIMKSRRRRITITLGLATALVLPAAPASALSGTGVDVGVRLGGKRFLDMSVTLGGHKRVVLDLVREYLAARDEGWKDTQSSAAALAAIKTEGAQVAAQPTAFAAGPATLAAEAEDDNGLRATEVATGFADDAKVKFKGRTASVTITSGTAMTWNDANLGESSLSDTYVVTLEREKRTWTITDVSYAPTPSAAAPTSGSADTAAAGSTSPAADKPVGVLAEHTYDRGAAVAYAKKWSKTMYFDGMEWVYDDVRNPDYDDLGGTNCANFVSQALYAGGWTKTGGFNASNPLNWDDNLTGPIYAQSKSWIYADWLRGFAVLSGRGENKVAWPPEDVTDPGSQDVWELEPGDLLFADWDPNKVADGTIDHAMIITGTYTSMGFTEPTYSQNSPNRYNLPLSIGMKIATSPEPEADPGTGYGGQGRTAVYYPVRLYDTFSD
ncbi:amidase domain-containing protein [Streptomyces sp. NPDC046909]|uniref:amidase domain-containing protein n=1 Tax=Streptomyces sp. NPDC046909 TaxID=3155617 RepID=UPI0033FED533